MQRRNERKIPKRPDQCPPIVDHLARQLKQSNFNLNVVPPAMVRLKELRDYISYIIKTKGGI